MGIVFRKKVKLGPLSWNFGKRGFSSWGFKLGPWSWNSRTRAQRVDLPGPFSWTSSRQRSSNSMVKVIFWLFILGFSALSTLAIIAMEWLGV